MQERCNNFEDPVSLDSIIEIPEKYLYRIKCGNIINCYDIRQLVQWLETGHDNDPLCEDVIPNEIRRDIYLKYNEMNFRMKLQSRQPEGGRTHSGAIRSSDEYLNDPTNPLSLMSSAGTKDGVRNYLINLQSKQPEGGRKHRGAIRSSDYF